MSISDKLYRRIVEAVPEGVWVCDPQGRTIFSNRRMAEILGVDFESMPQTSCFGCLFPEDVEEANRRFSTALVRGDMPAFDFRLRRADGSEVWVSISCMIFPDDTGAPAGLLGLFSDITERRRTEAALRESEDRFRKMADMAPVMIWVTDPETKVTFVNKTWLNFTGRTMEQELGHGWACGIHTDDVQRCFDAFGAAFAARGEYKQEKRLRRADGVYRSVLCTGVPRFAPDGAFAGYIGSTVDVTDLQSEERFQQLAENIDQVFWMFDIATNEVLYVSPAFEKIWGCSPTPIYRDRDWLLQTLHPEDRESFMVFREDVKAESGDSVYRIVRPDGTIRWIHDRGILIRDAQGKPSRIAGIAEDVTARRELEEQLRQAQKMEAIGRLAGGIAHDFNNLLTIIGGHAQMLLDGAHTEDPRRKRVEEILGAANRASILTSQLLAFSRKQVLQPTVVNVNHLLINMEALLRRIIGEPIAIETELDPELRCIKIDPHQLEQVVLNLAANARDAMPDSGRFRIETSMDDAPDKPGAESLREAGKCVRLRFSDTGCGMDTPTLERAFEPFFTTKGLGKGTGLGLSTVYGIVRQHQGTIQVSSEPGEGSIFDLYFPAVAENQAEIEPAAPSRRRNGASAATVLVAEDEDAVRAIVRQTLEDLGHTILEAADGYEALRIIEKHHGEIDLLLTDVIMPLLNGYELAKRVKAARPATKVLYMSGYTDEVLAFHGAAQPDVDFIQKPFTPADLARRVETVLAARKETGSPQFHS